ncbi:hypothetical protein G7Z17_g1662 [Cylindrodendrum hubeiense]|uniref:carboxypeptidase C n=1 Tax=Cylindrodendrum hubeiense TaxID=595255 RepID=A0A9P5LLY0_9HYPO|nr:hypothetical protein G7Z17_g1662 [Cylindrodendrum hubeiense]
MLFIDQPIGAGFSETTDPSLWAANLVEAGIDFDKFLDTFLDDLFPTLRDRPIHIAGESFGGKYVPVYTSMTRHKVDSVILVNALVNMPQTVLGLYDHFCVPFPTANEEASPRRFNASSCTLMAEGYSQCDKFSRICDSTYDSDICFTAFEKCMPLYELFFVEVAPGGRHPYDDRLTCDEPPMCGKLGMEPVSKYLNKGAVQNTLGFKETFDFRPVNMELNAKWSTQPDVWVPSTREIAELLDSKHTRVLVVNGNNDIIVNTEGVLKTYDAMLWTGHTGFQAEEFKPWYFQDTSGENVRGGSFKANGNLTIVTVDEAGHMSPRDQPKAVAEVVRNWMDNADH